MSLAKAQQYDQLSRIARASIQPLQEVHQEPDQHDPFVDEAKNRLEQDVLMASNGIRTRVVLERLKRYKAYMTQPGAEELDVVNKYKDQVLNAIVSSGAAPPYVPGDEILGDTLRSFVKEPTITGPLVCQLCPATKKRRVQHFICELENVKFEDKAVLPAVNREAAEAMPAQGQTEEALASSVHREDVKWLLHPDLVDAALAFQKSLRTVAVLCDEFEKVEALFQQLALWSERHTLLMKMQGLIADRRKAFQQSAETFQMLQKAEEELDIRFNGLMKKAAEVWAAGSPQGSSSPDAGQLARLPCGSNAAGSSGAEYSADIARDVLAHMDLAADDRVKVPVTSQNDEESKLESDDDEKPRRARACAELVDIGGGGDGNVDAEMQDVQPGELSRFPLRDVSKTIRLCFQQPDLDAINTKNRKSDADLNLKKVDRIYGSVLRGQQFGMDAGAKDLKRHGFGKDHATMLALQENTIALAKKRKSDDAGPVEEVPNDSGMLSGASEPPDADWIAMPEAMQGPAAVAWKLLTEAECTEEQIDAVALLALSMQKRFDARPDKKSLRLPVATFANNHRAVWLGGTGVGKTRTLSMVVQPLAETFFGPDGYSATAHSVHAARNLGPKGRTLYSANGLLMNDSLRTGMGASQPAQRPRLKTKTTVRPAVRKTVFRKQSGRPAETMDRIVGQLGVDVIDELGAVPGDLLHADALRKTHARCLRHNLDTMLYMKPEETWGRMPAKILAGDFFALSPVPASASLLAPDFHQSYEHQQGVKLLFDMEYVVDFVQMQRFKDPLLVEVLEAMRTPGGKKISEDAW